MLNRLWIFLIICITACTTGCTVKKENVEQKQLFDLNWKFHQGDYISAIEFDFNDTRWRNLDLPHDWSMDERLSRKNFLVGEANNAITNVGWYRKRFILPPEWQSKCIAVFFEGVKAEIKVYLNGNLLECKSGSPGSFHYELTPHLDYKEKNIIAVRLSSLQQQKDGMWPRGTGISRHVWLLVADKL